MCLFLVENPKGNIEEEFVTDFFLEIHSEFLLKITQTVLLIRINLLNIFGLKINKSFIFIIYKIVEGYFGDAEAHFGEIVFKFAFFINFIFEENITVVSKIQSHFFFFVKFCLEI